MKNIIILVLSIVLMASCASSNRLTTRIRYANRDSKHRFYGSDKHYDVHYSSSPEGKRDREQVFYVVDTIKITDHLIISEKGNMFVLSQSAYEKNPKNIKKQMSILFVWTNQTFTISCLQSTRHVIEPFMNNSIQKQNRLQ